jgi:fucose 4-O-acetylase-like acetyltransferase
MIYSKEGLKKLPKLNKSRQKLDSRIQIAKALAIIMMVVGHSGCPQGLLDFIYWFHMPLFFFVSGYFFKLSSCDRKWDFVKKKFRQLCVPFIGWSLVFLCFHNVLEHWHIINKGLYQPTDFLTQGLKYLTMTGSEQLLGGFWFLKDLFVCSIFVLMLMFLLRDALNINSIRRFSGGGGGNPFITLYGCCIEYDKH